MPFFETEPTMARCALLLNFSCTKTIMMLDGLFILDCSPGVLTFLPRFSGSRSRSPAMRDILCKIHEVGAAVFLLFAPTTGGGLSGRDDAHAECRCLYL